MIVFTTGVKHFLKSIMKIIKQKKEYVISVNDYYLKIVFIEKSTIEELYRKTGIIFSQRGSIIASSDGYWIGDNNNGSPWFYLFDEKFTGKDRNIFMNEILGYNDKKSGESPYCKTPEDNVKLMNETIKKILYKY